MFEQYWYASGSAGPGPVPPDPGQNIGESLRFRGAERLTRTMTSNSGGIWTWSAWIKKTEEATSGDSLIFGTTSPLQFHFIRGNVFTITQSTVQDNDGIERRDPAAWYHRVDVSDGTTIRMFINGVETISWDQASVGVNTNIEHFFGGDSARPSEFFQGYLADTYFIDGQALLPTAFGRFNDAEVWVPREVDFTPATMRFSDFLTCAPGNFNVASPATAAFDGDNTTFAEGTNTGDVLTFAPVPGIAYNSLEIAVRNDDQEFSLNGGAATSIANNRTTPTFVEIDDTPGTLDTLVIEGAAGEPGSLWAIRITDDDGTRELLNPFLWSAGVTLLGTGSEGGFDDPPENMFDGNTNTHCIGNRANQVIRWLPPSPISYNQSVEIWTPSAPNANIVYLFNDGTELVSVDNLENAWTTVITGSGTFDDLRVQGVNTDCRCSAVRVDGQIYIDGANSSYGANGFHLDFADPDDIGADRSGNGNSFNATNFGTNPPNNDLLDNFSPTASLPPFNEGQNAMEEPFLFPAMFNGLATAGGGVTVGGEPAIAMSQGGGITATWNGNLSRPLGVDFTLLIYRQQDANDVTITGSNSNTVVYSAPSPASTISTHDLTGLLDAQDITEVTSISWTRNGAPTNNGFGIGGIEIDGRRVTVDGSGTDYDVMQDSPTQNWATLNPLIAGPFGFSTVAANLADANLQLGTPSAGSTDPTAIPTQIITGRKYFEVNVVSGNSGLTFYLQPEGVDPENATVQQNRIVNLGGANTGAASGLTINDADGTQEASVTAPAGARVISLDVDTGTGNVRVFLNGDLQGTGTGYTGNRVLQFLINGQTGAYEVFFNGGQQPFLHRPAGLDDTNNLQTQNLPEAPIRAGRDHFGVLTYEGDNTAGRNVTGLSFTPGLVWVKNRDLSRDHVVSDNRMNSGRKVIPNTPNGNGAMTASDDFVRGFVDGGFTVGNNDQVNGDNTNDYVAWCWRSADANTNVTETDAIPSSCRINTAAGFSIIQFTGNTDTDRVGHGLDREPEFVISKCLGVGSTAWQIYHHDLGVGSFLPFTTSAMSNIANFWGTAANWNNNTCGLSTTGSDNNRNNELMRWYAWHGVEGFSRFGSFTGNGQTNGSFVHLGFKPALLVIRAAQTGTNGEEPWMVYDSAREPNNPVNEALEWNSRNAEGATARDVDLLSNGFKLRSAGNQVNGNTTNYIYAAWAEMPAGASNTSPATAR